MFLKDWTSFVLFFFKWLTNKFSYMTAFSSIPTSKRVQIFDILKGFALFGILVVNSMDYRFSVPPTATNFNETNEWFYNVSIALAEGTFYPLFSLLFGIGFAIWIDKSMKQNGGVLRFIWRSFLLLLFGCIFYCFIEERYILIRYPILSIPLLLFYKAQPKTLIVGAAVFLLLTVFYHPDTNEIYHFSDSEVQAQQQNEPVLATTWNWTKKIKDYKSSIKTRIIKLPYVIEWVLTFADDTLPLIFSMFLLGVFSWRKRLFTEFDKNIKLWRNIFWWGLIVGLGGNIITVIVRTLALKNIYILNTRILWSIEVLSNPALTFFYISLFVFALQKAKNKNNVLFNVLSYTGQIPLTNYFVQYAIMTMIMAPYGLNLNGMLFSQYLLLLSIAVFSLQVLFSVFWTKRFVYGPMEWLWRSLTYLKVQRLLSHNNKTLIATPV